MDGSSAVYYRYTLHSQEQWYFLLAFPTLKRLCDAVKWLLVLFSIVRLFNSDIFLSGKRSREGRSSFVQGFNSIRYNDD